MKNNAKDSSLYRLAGGQGREKGRTSKVRGCCISHRLIGKEINSFFLCTFHMFPQVFSCTGGICCCRELGHSVSIGQIGLRYSEVA